MEYVGPLFCIFRLKASLRALVIPLRNMSLWLAKVDAIALLIVSYIALC
jgi:hypothetical protein